MAHATQNHGALGLRETLSHSSPTTHTPGAAWVTAPLTSHPVFQHIEVDSIMPRTFCLTLKTTETYYFSLNSNTV